MDPPNVVHISEKPWSDYTEADYTIEQWHSACLIHLHEGPPTSKSQCKLPVKTPNGALSRNGVHAAAAALAGARSPLKASPEQKAKAANALRRYYSQLDETPPDSLKQSAMLIDDILEHHGVKGMKWGVRQKATSVGTHLRKQSAAREQKRGEYHQKVAAAKAEVEKSTPHKSRFKERFSASGRARAQVKREQRLFEREVKSREFKAKLHNDTVNVMNNYYIPKINAKHATDLANGNVSNPNHPASKKYYDDVMNTYVKEVNKHIATLTDVTATRSVVATRRDPTRGDPFAFDIHIEDVEHADTVLYTVKGILGSDGAVVDLEMVEGSMTQGEEAVDHILHFGVKGMKWGVRRKATVNPKEIIVRDTRSRLPTSIKEPRIKTKGGKELPAHREALRARTIGQKRKGSGLKTLSDQELKEYANRLQLEQNVKRLEYNELSPGKKFIRRVSGQSMQNASQSAATELGKKALKAAALA